MEPDCVFSRLSTHTTGILDFNCYCVETLILVIEVKRKHILEGIKEQAFPEFYQASEKARMVIQQIYNYMGENKLRYGILTTYDNHWFLCQEHTELWVSKTLPLEPKSPPVLKAYAYLTQQAKENPNSPHPLQVPVQAHGNNNSYVLQSQLKLSSNQSANQQTTPSTLFHGDTIVLKSVDLSKAPPYVLEEMQKEVEIYKDLADIQGKYIPKLHIITKRQKSRAIKGLEMIHKHGILHNDIQEENVLINDNGNVYLIDFGMGKLGGHKKEEETF
ncbi:7843_t:CDS:2 [Entrophospora sp. SA101]|nr:7843_t:CDS:2 [Entrophospora sp. SA101]